MMMHEMKKSQSSAQEEYREQQAVNNILFGGEWIYTTFSLDATAEFIQLTVSHDMGGHFQVPLDTFQFCKTALNN